MRFPILVKWYLFCWISHVISLDFSWLIFILVFKCYDWNNFSASNHRTKFVTVVVGLLHKEFQLPSNGIPCCYSLSQAVLSWTFNHPVCTKVPIEIYIHLILGCCPYPIRWGWQYQAMSNPVPPCISHIQTNARLATFSGIILHTFGPRISRPFLPYTAGNH